MAFIAATAVTTNATTYATASFTPTAGDLLVFFAMVTGATGNAATVTDSLSQLTFSLVGTALKAASADTMYMFIANQFATASARTLTFHTSGGTTATGGSLSNWKVTGNSRVGPDAIRQFAVSSNGAAAGTPAPVFGKAALTGNPCFGAVGNATSPATMTPPTSWTEDNDLGYATPTTGWEVVHIASGFTGTTVTWGSTSATAFGAMVVEIDTSSRPFSSEFYETSSSEELPGFDMNMRQGFLSTSVAEANIGDNPEEFPIVFPNVFNAPMYEPNNEYPGFNFMLSQGLLTNAVAEANLGDNVELPPTVRVIGQISLMGYKGYSVPTRILRQFDDMPVLAPVVRMGTDVILMGYRGYSISRNAMVMGDFDVEKTPTQVVTVFNDWTNDQENQILQPGYVFDGLSEPDYGDNPELPPTLTPNDWTSDAGNQLLQLGYMFDVISEPDYGDSIELPPALTSWTDTILMGYTGYKVPTRILTQAQDYDVEEPIVVVVVFNDWTNDQENQLFMQPWYEDAMEYQDRELLVLPYSAWDNDGDNQIPNPNWNTDRDVTDTGVELVQPYRAWDTDGENQIPQQPWYEDLLENQDRELLVLPSGFYDNDGENQLDRTWRFGQDDVQDAGTELVQPYEAWDTDGDNQVSNMFWFSRDEILDNRVELVEPSMAWDNDGDNQEQWQGWTTDKDLADSGVERIQIALTTGWDNDSENQIPNPLWSLDQLELRDGELQIEPYMAWDNDGENQLDRSWWVGDDLSDTGVELLPFVGVISSITLMGYKGWNFKPAHLMDEEVELIQLNPTVAALTAWDNDTENQKDNSWWFSQDETQVDEFFPQPPLIVMGTDTILMGYRGYSIGKSMMVEEDNAKLVQPSSAYDDQNDFPGFGGTKPYLEDEVLVQTTLITVFDGLEDMENWNWTFQGFDFDDREQIVLPYQAYDNDGDNQRPQADYYRDQNEFRDWEIIVEPAFFFDNDAENQIPNAWWFGKDDEGDSGIELVQPWEAWDDGWDNNRTTQIWFGTDGLSDEGVERITLPPNEWTTDAEHQIQQLGFQGLGSDQGQDWTEYIIIPTVVTQLTAFDTDGENQLDRNWWIRDGLADETVEKIFLPFNPWDDDQELRWADTIKDNVSEDVFFVTTPLGYDMDTENQLPQPNWTTDRDVMDQMTELVQIALTTGWDQPEANQLEWLPTFNKQDLGIVESTNFVQPIFVPWTQHEDELWTGTNVANIGSDQGQDTTNYIILPVQIDLDAEQQIPNPGWYRDWDREEVTLITLPPGVVDRDWSLLEDQLMWALWNLDQSDYWNLLRFIQISVPLKAYKVAALFALLATIQVTTSLTVEQVQVSPALEFDSVLVGIETGELTVRDVIVVPALVFDSVIVGVL